MAVDHEHALAALEHEQLDVAVASPAVAGEVEEQVVVAAAVAMTATIAARRPWSYVRPPRSTNRPPPPHCTREASVAWPAAPTSHGALLSGLADHPPGRPRGCA